MANPNWQADFEQALAEEDRSDPSSKNIFQNRELALTCVVFGVIAALVAVFATYASHSQVLSHDDQEWYKQFAIWSAFCAVIQLPLGFAGLALLRKRAATTPACQKRTQAVSGPPIGW